MHSIRIKTTAITIAAVLISIITLGAISVYIVGVESDRGSAGEMNLLCAVEKTTLDSYYLSLEQSVDTVAQIANDTLQGDDAANLLKIPSNERTPQQSEELDAYLKKHGLEMQEAFTSVANHANGVVTYYYCINPEVGKPEDGFFFSKVGEEDFVAQPTLDASTLDPNDMEHYTWYFTPIERGEACWLGPYRAHFLNEVWTVSYVMPIYKDGVLLGVLGMDILFETMVDQISSIQVYDTGFVALLDNDGRILYHPKFETGSTPENVSTMLTTGIFQSEDSEGELLRYVADGEERQLAFSTLVNGMKIVVIAPVSEIAESQRHLTQMIIAVAVLLIAVFTVLTLFFMRAVTGPLQHLTAASQRLADGDYDVELEYRGKDEVGMLTDAFRRMRDKLEEHIGDLNVRVTTDALTGIKNKAAFDDDALRLNDQIDAGTGANAPQFAIAMFDCNRLKMINDEYGHERGDVYLRTACKAICQTFAHSPVYRVGGDEFVALLQHRDYEDREQLQQSFVQLCSDMSAAASDPWETVSLSMGMAVYEPGKDATVEQVLHRADELMYAEKRLYKASRDQ